MRCSGPSIGWLLLLVCLFLVPSSVHAHAPIKGMNDFVNGLLHPLTTLTHLLILIGLGLMLGRRTPLKLKAPVMSFAPAAAAGLAVASSGWIQQVHPAVLTGLALFVGALLALEKTPPFVVTCALLLVAGVLIGLDSGMENETGWKLFKTLFGTWLCLNLVLFDLAIYVSLGAQAKWLQVALRVVGSWIIAISLLVLAFSFRKVTS